MKLRPSSVSIPLAFVLVVHPPLLAENATVPDCPEKGSTIYVSFPLSTIHMTNLPSFEGTILGAGLQHYEQASIDRIAISRALIAGGYLVIRRRRITPPVSVLRLRKVS